MTDYDQLTSLLGHMDFPTASTTTSATNSPLFQAAACMPSPFQPIENSPSPDFIRLSQVTAASSFDLLEPSRHRSQFHQRRHSVSFFPYQLSYPSQRRLSVPTAVYEPSFLQQVPTQPDTANFADFLFSNAFPLLHSSMQPTAIPIPAPKAAPAQQPHKEPGLDLIPAQSDATPETLARQHILAETGKLPKFRANESETALLSAVFALNPFPSLAMRERLAKHFQCNALQVQFWFQNRRQDMKTQGVIVCKPQEGARKGLLPVSGDNTFFFVEKK